MRCPQCQSPNLENRGRPSKLHSVGFVMVLGVFGATMIRNSRPSQFHCRYCGAQFLRRTVMAKISLVSLIILAHVFGIGLLFLIANILLQR